MDNSITKRLHISGLTPSLTTADLSKRLSSFGAVKELDGFGLANGIGQPRAFGYVTIETTERNLSKCLNVLSGSTWKGAKLRIGEARPDYAERLARERENVKLEPPKKKHRRAYGVESPDMSLVTPENATQRRGWKVSPMGRIVRPMRMRPARPLMDVAESKKVKATGGNINRKGTGDVNVGQKKRKREKRPVIRARRRTIDPTRWDSTHLKGAFLDVVTIRERKTFMTEGLICEGKSEGSESSGESRESGESESSEESEESTVEEPPLAKQQQIKLKDLFAPREEVGFSLLDHLDPDLESDDEAVVPSFAPSSTHQNAPSTSAHIPLAPSRTHFELDPRRPLFFPVSSSISTSTNGRTKDLFDVARENGWNWRDPAVGFYRTDTVEDIKGRWEREKVELTRDWKKRSREAGKMRKRRGGGDED